MKDFLLVLVHRGEPAVTQMQTHTQALFVRSQFCVFSAVVPQSRAAGGPAVKNRSLECSQRVLLLFFYLVFTLNTSDEEFYFEESRGEDAQRLQLGADVRSAPLPAAQFFILQ